MTSPHPAYHPYRYFRALLVLAPLVLAPVSAPGSAMSQSLDPANQEVVITGQDLYQEHCASCHGVDLEGEANWKTRKENGRMPAPPHDVSGHTWHHNDRILFTLTKEGPAALAGASYQSDMPAYKEILSDEEIIAVLSYIKSTWPEDIQARHDEINRNSP